MMCLAAETMLLMLCADFFISIQEFDNILPATGTI